MKWPFTGPCELTLDIWNENNTTVHMVFNVLLLYAMRL